MKQPDRSTRAGRRPWRTAVLCLSLTGFLLGAGPCDPPPPPPPPPPVVPPPPQSDLLIDLDSRTVYIPDAGWISEDEFWQIYYNEPERLPGRIDFSLLDQLGYPAAPPSG